MENTDKKLTEQTLQTLRERAKALRHDVVDMIGDHGKAGHLGGSCSLAEIAAALYFYKMRYDPAEPKNPARDRLILSKGHAAIIQYAALCEAGFFPREELAKFKTVGAMLQGHPDMRKTLGIEANTGSLGQGLSIGLGMALGTKADGLDARTYVIMGDGELAEGQIWEAAAAAASYHADNLIGIVDNNGLQATGALKDRLDQGDLAEKWRAFGWDVQCIDGHDLEQVCCALDATDEKNGKPKLILARTVKGKGIHFAENNVAFHNKALSPEEFMQAHAQIDEGF